MLGPQPALGVMANDIQHRISGDRPAFAAQHRDMREHLGAALLRADKAEALLIIPVFQGAALLHA